MSLRTFHLFFISMAVLLCVGFGFWSFREPGYFAAGIGSFVVAAGLAVYEITFLRRTR